MQLIHLAIRRIVVTIAIVAPIPALCQTPDWAGRALGNIIGPSSQAAITIEDIARLRDIGGLQLSPDGKYLAFSVRQAVPEIDAYVIRWFVANTTGVYKIKQIDVDGGQPIPSMLLGFPQAALPDALPIWAPDSQRFAIRRQESQRIELWVVDVASARGTMIADGAYQVSSFAWISPTRLTYGTSLSFERYQDAIEQESRHGWLWDARIAHSTGRLRPMIPDCAASPNDPACTRRTWLVDLSDGTRRQIDGTSDKNEGQEAALAPRRRADGASLFLDIVDQRFAQAGTPLMRVSTDIRGAKRCSSEACVGARFRAFGWGSDGKAIWFVKSLSDQGRDDGAPGDQMAIFEWRPNSGSVRQVYSIAGTLDSCQLSNEMVFCIEERSTKPAAIVAISLISGKRAVIADPNPMFMGKRFPRIERLILHDGSGAPYFSQIVYPINFNPSQKYPLVVTQYNDRGFLRGQVGNEYPIFPMAEEGFFVLSVNWGRPPNDLTRLSIDLLNKDYSEHGREIIRKVIDSGVDYMIATGFVDEKKIALTGLSAGAEIVNYMLQRTDRFATAIASSGAQDATFFALMPEGPLRTRLMNEFGASRTVERSNAALDDISWSNKGEKLKTPYLINVGEYEAMIGFEGTQSIIHAGGPLEMRIFPDEQHIKYHPRTYIGIYENNMQWLKFWLNGEIDPSPTLADQYRRWKSMSRPNAGN